MDEVEAVTQAVNEVIGDGDTSLEASRAFAERIARAAIAALDGCRNGVLMEHVLMGEPPPRTGAYAMGRKAGLREAAALCRRKANDHGWNYHLPSVGRELEAGILALIDAGSPTPPGSD